MEQLSQKESKRLSSSTGGGTLRGVLLSNAKIAAAQPREQGQLLEALKTLPIQTVEEPFFFVRSYAMLSEVLPVSLLAAKPLLQALHAFWNKHCYAQAQQNPMAQQLLSLHGNPFLFPETIHGLCRLLEGYAEKGDALCAILGTMTPLSTKGQQALVAFLSEVGQEFQLTCFTPNTLGTVADYWARFFWKNKKKRRTSRKFRSGAFRKGMLWQALQLMAKLKKGYGIPKGFFQALLDSLQYSPWQEMDRHTHELVQFRESLAHAQRHGYTLLRLFKLVSQEGPELDMEPVIRFTMELVKAQSGGFRKEVEEWVKTYGPYRIIRYLPNFCLQRSLHYQEADQGYISHLLEGKNIRSKPDNPWPLSKKGAHIFHSELPTGIDNFHEGITYAFLCQCGFEEEEVLLLGNMLIRSNYYCRILQVEIQVTHDPAYVHQVAGFFKKYRNQMGESERAFYMSALMLLKSEDPSFSPKGRNLGTIEAMVKKYTSGFEKITWQGLDIPDWETEHEGVAYKIVQLKNNWELNLEGEMMGHCVGGYSHQCAYGSTSIWSLRKVLQNGKEKRLVTIEVEKRSRSIRQAQGRCNSNPNDLCKVLIRQWKEERLIKKAEIAA